MMIRKWKVIFALVGLRNKTKVTLFVLTLTLQSSRFINLQKLMKVLNKKRIFEPVGFTENIYWIVKDPNIFNEPWSNDAESVMGQSFLFLFQTFVLRHHISTEFLISLWSIAVRKVLSFVVITLNVSTKWLYEPTLNRLGIDKSENKVKDICISIFGGLQYLCVFRTLGAQIYTVTWSEGLLSEQWKLK